MTKSWLQKLYFAQTIMQSIITSYLLQSRECSLEHIGTILISSKPAALYIAHKQILPPASEITFTEGANQSSPGLIKYIAQKKGYSADVAESILSDFCTEWKERIDTGEPFVFDTLGSLQKNNAGNIFFKSDQNYEFLKPVTAERVIHQNAEHNVLVGDKEVSSILVPEYKIEEPVVKRSNWWIWAAMLAVIGLTVIIYHFSKQNFTSSSTGNQTNIVIDSTGRTHSEIQGN